jgi:hypothetical protein
VINARTTPHIVAVTRVPSTLPAPRSTRRSVLLGSATTIRSERGRERATLTYSMVPTAPALFILPSGNAARSVEERHLARWNETAADWITAQWIEIGISESWFAAFGGRVDLVEWTTNVKDGSQHTIDIAIEDSAGDLQVALTLMGGDWIHGPDTPAVEVGVACHPSARGYHLARSAVSTAIEWVRGLTEMTHVCARVCEANVRSHKLVGAVHMGAVRTLSPCISASLHSCNDRETHYCTCAA